MTARLRWAARSSERCSALLLVHAGEVVATERLVNELWGERPPKTATTSLQNFVSQLRKLLGPETLETKAPGYILRVDRDRFDLARFEALGAEAARAPSPQERAKLLREALALWRGPPLADLAFETFAQAEIRRLEELRLEAVESRIDADLELGAGGELVGELESLVVQFPLRERLRGAADARALPLGSAGGRDSGATTMPAASSWTSSGSSPGRHSSRSTRRSCARSARSSRMPRSRTREDQLVDMIKALLAGRLVPVLGTAIGGSAPDAAQLDSAPRRAVRLSAGSSAYARAGRRVRAPDAGSWAALRRAARALRRRTRARPRPRVRRRAGAIPSRAGPAPPAGRDERIRRSARARACRCGRGAGRRLVRRARRERRQVRALSRTATRRSSTCRTPTRASRSASARSC